MQLAASAKHHLSFTAIWRILASVAIIQLISGLYVMTLDLSANDLINAFYGAALSTPTGLMFGLIWQAIHSKKSIRENLFSINTLLVLSLLISASTTLISIK